MGKTVRYVGSLYAGMKHLFASYDVGLVPKAFGQKAIYRLSAAFDYQ